MGEWGLGPGPHPTAATVSCPVRSSKLLPSRPWCEREPSTSATTAQSSFRDLPVPPPAGAAWSWWLAARPGPFSSTTTARAPPTSCRRLPPPRHGASAVRHSPYASAPPRPRLELEHDSPLRRCERAAPAKTRAHARCSVMVARRLARPFL